MKTETPVQQSDQSAMLQEPGAEDNRISLDPADPRWSATIGSWRDGQRYKIVGGEIEQMAPGEFRVVNIRFGGAGSTPNTSDEEAGESGAAEPAEGEPAAPAAGSAGAYGNPAVDRMME